MPCWVRRPAARPLPDVRGVPLRRLPDRLEQRADQAGVHLLMHLSTSRTTVSARRGRPPAPMERGFVSGLLTRISRVPDRLLHNGRRRAALAALAAAGRGPAPALGVFQGNIFREPVAAPVLCARLLLRGAGGES